MNRHDEDDIERALTDGLARNAARLESAGLSASLPKWTRGGDDESYGSEVRVDFLSAGGLADVIEFVVFEGGLQRVEADELTDWLDDTLLDVASRADRRRT